ncbi:acylneuraminate cytidylyltransferase [Desulfatibacillum aliphaticivorans]|uniref:Acylneuraminate cytidylyltransferase n=1 Tax=Desulfatibacillum aliphaticivorans TaxID=218208 RepID=B8FAS3_DESAL|nr:acylneuraminate cytidylyltransferase family protein [Desulfatibacillum aliphaticivorans]ACL03369.1 acylneuraminate cytidylyltransferase [Desulfatibacillum aliphaticivorans]
MKKVLAVIPARGGSKGVPRKNIRSLGDKPLIGHILETAGKSKYLDRVIVSTDDEEIMQAARDAGAEAPFVRPAELSVDTAPLLSVVLHAFHYYEEKGEPFDAVINIQPTCPFLSSDTLDEAVELWMESGCQSVVPLAEVVTGHPYITKRVLGDRSIENFCQIPEGAVVAPRQKREKAYYLTGGFYLRDRNLLLQEGLKGHALGDDCRAVIVDEIQAVDINTEMDFLFARFLKEQGLA